MSHCQIRYEYYREKFPECFDENDKQIKRTPGYLHCDCYLDCTDPKCDPSYGVTSFGLKALRDKKND